MEYRPLGRTGLKVSAVGVGTWQFGGEWGINYSQPQVDAILDKAAELGLNLIDTAECYGDHLSEKLIGNYLARRDRFRWIVATKFGHHFHNFMNRTPDFSPVNVRKQLEDSLKALQIETIDLYQFHSGSDVEFLNDELWGMLQEQKKAGKIRHLGISIPGKGSAVQVKESARFGAEVIQVIYNRLDREAEQAVFPQAQKDNIGILARVPLASGLLTGKYAPGTTFPSNDVRATAGIEKLPSRLTEAERIRQTEVPTGIPMGQWALAWCLKNQMVSAVIPGCKNPQQVEDNARAVTQ